jgi:hypothetical protein
MMQKQMDGLDDNPNVSEEEFLEYVVVVVAGNTSC